MSLLRKIFYGGLIISAGQVVSQVLASARNVLIGRWIVSEAEMGIATTLILVVSFSDMLTNIGTHTLVVQDSEGGDPGFLKVAHFSAFVRGMVGAVLSVVLAYPVALAFGIPDATWAFAALGFIPFIRGFFHFELYQIQREHTFLPSVFQEASGQMITLIVCVPILVLFRDYSAVLYLLIFQTAIMTVLSHVVAKQPYRWARNPEIERRVLAFGVPLMLNGIVFFLITQGERIAIGSSRQLFPGAHYTMEDMAAFSVAFMVASLVTQFLARVLSGMFMPLLARNDQGRFLDHSAICTQSHAFGGGMIAIPFIIYGDTIIDVLYNGRYSASGTVLIATAATQALLMLRSGANLAMMSRGHTWDAFTNSLWRVTGFAGSFAVAAMGLSLPWIAVPGVVGELIAIVVLSRQLNKRCGTRQIDTLRPLFLLLVGLGMATALRLFGAEQNRSLSYAAIGLLCWMGFAVMWCSMFSQNSQLIRDLISRLRRRKPSHEGSV